MNRSKHYREFGEEEAELDGLLGEFESGKLGRQPTLSSGAVVPLGCALFAMSAFVACSVSFAVPWLAFAFLIAGFIGAFWLNRFTATDAQRYAIRRLATYDDVRVVPPMIDALSWPAADVQGVASVTLVRLLPEMSWSDGGTLHRRHRQILRDQLSNYVYSNHPDEMLTYAILTALEQFGTKNDVYSVMAIVRKPVAHPEHKRIQEKAVALIPILKAREADPVDTLLRPAETPPESALLRPAGDSATDHSSLLRPTDPEDKPET